MAGGARGRGPLDCAQRQRVDAGTPQPDDVGAVMRSALRLDSNRDVLGK